MKEDEKEDNLDWRHRDKCSLCGLTAGRTTLFETVVRFPDTPLANEYPELLKDAELQEVFPLAVVMCGNCGHAQSSIVVDPQRLFRGYVYETSTSPLTIKHLQEEARQIYDRLELRTKVKPFIVEVGSNDGSFLKQMRDVGVNPKNLLGIDPAQTMAARANHAGIQTMNTFFDEDVVRSIVKNRGRADVVVANNVLAHVPDVRLVLTLIRSLLADDGVLVMEVAHAADVLAGAFDTIYHEHMSHHALVPLALAFDAVGLRLLDVEKNEGQVGRGSLRVYATQARSSRRPSVDALKRCVSMVEQEKTAGICDPEVWKKKIGELVLTTRKHLRKFIDGYRKVGSVASVRKVVAAYGAPAKLTTLAHSCVLDRNDINYVVDDSSWKQKLHTPGIGWPIVSSTEMTKRPPDAVIVFAWNFADDIAKKLRAEGFKVPIAVPLPTWRLLP